MEIIEIIVKYLITAIVRGLIQLAAARLKGCFPNQQPSPLSPLSKRTKMPGLQKHRLKMKTLKIKRYRKY